MKHLKVTIWLSGNRELCHLGHHSIHPWYNFSPTGVRRHILLIILLSLPNLNNWELLFIYIARVECFGLFLTINSVNRNHWMRGCKWAMWRGQWKILPMFLCPIPFLYSWTFKRINLISNRNLPKKRAVRESNSIMKSKTLLWKKMQSKMIIQCESIHELRKPNSLLWACVLHSERNTLQCWGEWELLVAACPLCFSPCGCH